MKKVMLQVVIVFVMSFVVINQSAAWVCACVATAQESTQITNKIQLIYQLQEQIQMVKNQFQMLEGLTGGMVSGLTGANSQILQQFKQVQDVWKQATSLTHAMDNFTDLHNKRHPEHVAGTQVNAEEERRRRDKEWREMADAYLEGLNMNAQDLENSAKAREKLFASMQTTEGQVQAVQALGAFINHTSALVEKNGEILSGYVTMFAENEQDKRDEADNTAKNLELAFDEAKNVQPSGKGYSPKPAW